MKRTIAMVMMAMFVLTQTGVSYALRPAGGQKAAANGLQELPKPAAATGRELVKDLGEFGGWKNVLGEARKLLDNGEIDALARISLEDFQRGGYFFSVALTHTSYDIRNKDIFKKVLRESQRLYRGFKNFHLVVIRETVSTMPRDITGQALKDDVSAKKIVTLNVVCLKRNERFNIDLVQPTRAEGPVADEANPVVARVEEGSISDEDILERLKTVLADTSHEIKPPYLRQVFEEAIARGAFPNAYLRQVSRVYVDLYQRQLKGMQAVAAPAPAAGTVRELREAVEKAEEELATARATEAVDTNVKEQNFEAAHEALTEALQPLKDIAKGKKVIISNATDHMFREISSFLIQEYEFDKSNIEQITGPLISREIEEYKAKDYLIIQWAGDVGEADVFTLYGIDFNMRLPGIDLRFGIGSPEPLINGIDSYLESCV